jgi:hypothetical protein
VVSERIVLGSGSVVDGHRPEIRRIEGTPMADHEVRLSTQNLLVAGIDIRFDVKVDGAVLGTLSVSEGALHWRPKGRQKSFGEEIPWREFAKWAES